MERRNTHDELLDEANSSTERQRPAPDGWSRPGRDAGLTGLRFSPAAGCTAGIFIENILRLNLGKMATIYMTFENNREWNAKVFRGRLEAAGRDHIIISEPGTGKRYLLLMVYLDYITFDEPLNYQYPHTEMAPGS